MHKRLEGMWWFVAGINWNCAFSRELGGPGNWQVQEDNVGAWPLGEMTP